MKQRNPRGRRSPFPPLSRSRGLHDMENEMTDIYQWEPAFPCSDYSGMTLRDWFAGQAMSTLCRDDPDNQNVAQQAYKIADAMLVERMVKP